MSRAPKNQLTIRDLGDGRFHLFGNILAKNALGSFVPIKIRRWSADSSELSQIKSELELAAADHLQGVANAGKTLRSHISVQQLHDAEAAFNILPPGRTLLECVLHANRTLGSGAPITCVEGLERWQRDMLARKLEAPTIKDALRRVKRFLAVSKLVAWKEQAPGAPLSLEAERSGLLLEITHGKAEAYVMRAESASTSQVNDANILTMWLKFCVDKKLLKEQPLDFQLKLLRERARPETEPEILTPNQCQRLLDASVQCYNGVMAPYVILGLWCFLRPTEPSRLRPADFITKGGATEIHHRGNKRGSDWRTAQVPDNVAPLLRHLLKKGAVRETELDTNGKPVKGGKGGVFFSTRIWMRIRERAGLLKLETAAGRGTMPTIKEGSSKWVPDILRHTGMSYLFQKLRNQHIKAGMTPNRATEEAMRDLVDQAGNSKRTAYMHYLRRVPADACDAFFAIKPTGKAAPMADVISMEEAVA